MHYFLFLAHIGPIQTFIASGRRTRDLYYGSGLLSELSKVLALTIANQYGIESLIFPAPETREDLRPGTPLDVANKVLARIPATEKPEVLGQQMRDNIQEYLKSRQEELQDLVTSDIAKLKKQPTFGAELERLSIPWDTARQQINEMIECFWATLPFTEENYAIKRLELEAIMAARKNARFFQQPTWGSEQAKSSITGELENILPEHFYPKEKAYRRQAIHSDNRKNATILQKIFHAGPAECLSGVDLLKRRGQFAVADANSQEKNRLNFPSTSHIAAMPYIQCLDRLDEKKQSRLKETWGKYLQQAAQLGVTADQALEYTKEAPIHPVLGNSDGGMLFAERLIQDTDYPEQLDHAQRALQAFFEQVNQDFEHSIQPSPYYAILVADGDSMGSVIDHQAHGDPGKTNGIEKHRQLTQALAEFAQKARQVVQETYNGVAIYTGGDDVMAFLPLHQALPCGLELAKVFQQHMQAFHNEKGKSPTLSAGIAITHHLELLQESLEIARNAEKRAKDVKEKNAVAITLAKRSGEQYSIVGHWQDVGHYVKQLIAFYASDSIPKGIAYDIRETVLRLQGLDSNAQDFQEIIQADIQRILLRRLTDAHQGLPPETRTDAELSWLTENLPAAVAHPATTLYELLQARTSVSAKQFSQAAASAKKQRGKASSEQHQTLLIRPAIDSHGHINFREFANELLIAQMLAETEILLATKRKEQQA